MDHVLTRIEYQDARFRIVREGPSVRIELRDSFWPVPWEDYERLLDELHIARAEWCRCCATCMKSVCDPDSELECTGRCDDDGACAAG